MARPKKAIPAYRYHISGQAIVTLGGKDYYLGPHDSPESHAKHLSLVKVYQENGLKMPKDLSVHQKDALITVCCVTAEYRESIQ